MTLTGKQRHVEQFSHGVCVCVCKVCGETLTSNVKERKPFNRPLYGILYEIAQDEWPPMSPADIHYVLASAPCYVCKVCLSQLEPQFFPGRLVDGVSLSTED